MTALCCSGEHWLTWAVPCLMPLDKRSPSSVPAPVLAKGKTPRIPNVRGWLKKWQLPLRLECPLCTALWEVLKGTSLVSCLCFHHAAPCFLPCCDHESTYRRILVFLAGQTSCCVWHSSFIDGLFFKCSRIDLSRFALTLGNPWGRPSYWLRTSWEHHCWLIMIVAYIHKNNPQCCWLFSFGYNLLVFYSVFTYIPFCS